MYSNCVTLVDSNSSMYIYTGDTIVTLLVVVVVVLLVVVALGIVGG